MKRGAIMLTGLATVAMIAAVALLSGGAARDHHRRHAVRYHVVATSHAWTVGRSHRMRPHER
ncbi:MAG: hypothetical protein ACJ760_14280 [Thermoleophilaceae bacterium]